LISTLWPRELGKCGEGRAKVIAKCVGLASRSRWPCGLRRRSAVLDCLDRSFESCWASGCSSLVPVVRCTGTGLCDELITRPEEFCQMHGLFVCERGTSKMRRPRPQMRCSVTEKKKENEKRILSTPSRASSSAEVFIFSC
jgi:hypothetical protein